jgi:hypothetical protein
VINGVFTGKVLGKEGISRQCRSYEKLGWHHVSVICKLRGLGIMSLVFLSFDITNCSFSWYTNLVISSCSWYLVIFYFIFYLDQGGSVIHCVDVN